MPCSSSVQSMMSLSARHIAWVSNNSADALSRNNLSRFFSVNPHTHPSSPRNFWSLSSTAACCGPHPLGQHRLLLPYGLCCPLHTVIIQISPAQICSLLPACRCNSSSVAQGGYPVQVRCPPGATVPKTSHHQNVFIRAKIHANTTRPRGSI